MTENSSLSVLVVDDEKISRSTTAIQLREAGYTSDVAEHGYAALELLADSTFDVVVADLRMPNMDGMQLLEEIKHNHSDVDVILVTAFGTVESAVAAMHKGAVDFLTKPFDFRELEARLTKLAEVRETRRQLNFLRSTLINGATCGGLLGRTPIMKQVFERLELFAENQAPVLVTGETGTGKELVARAVHEKSSRARAPFVAVGCGAIPRDLAESEIFGHERGSFTGALQRRKGSFERANGGTLLLDDVDDLPAEIQAKLLRTLQEGTISRVGAESEMSVDVRLIATSKMDLATAVKQKAFREDLYYRLCGLEIRLPPLRERADDILLLAQHFLKMISNEEGHEVRTLSPAAAERLRRHHWPGNVRELRRVLESASAVCRGDEIAPEHLPYSLQVQSEISRPFSLHLPDEGGLEFNEVTSQLEADLINWAMEQSGGDQGRAAALLKLPRTTFQSKLARVQ